MLQTQRLEEEGGQGRGEIQQPAQGGRHERNGKKIPRNKVKLSIRAEQYTHNKRDRQTCKYIDYQTGI